MSPGEKMIYAAVYGARIGWHGDASRAVMEAAEAIRKFRDLPWLPDDEGVPEYVMYKAMRCGS